jgi:hypothetical protein
LSVCLYFCSFPSVVTTISDVIEQPSRIIMTF